MISWKSKILCMAGRRSFGTSTILRNNLDQNPIKSSIFISSRLSMRRQHSVRKIWRRWLTLIKLWDFEAYLQRATWHFQNSVLMRGMSKLRKDFDSFSIEHAPFDGSFSLDLRMTALLNSFRAVWSKWFSDSLITFERVRWHSCASSLLSSSVFQKWKNLSFFSSLLRSLSSKKTIEPVRDIRKRDLSPINHISWESSIFPCFFGSVWSWLIFRANLSRQTVHFSENVPVTNSCGDPQASSITSKMRCQRKSWRGLQTQRAAHLMVFQTTEHCQRWQKCRRSNTFELGVRRIDCEWSYAVKNFGFQIVNWFAAKKRVFFKIK